MVSDYSEMFHQLAPRTYCLRFCRERTDDSKIGRRRGKFELGKGFQRVVVPREGFEPPTYCLEGGGRSALWPELALPARMGVGSR
jgi:hypothetical protein